MKMWQPIETAPMDNRRPLWLARFNGDTLQSFDYNGSWERECESWEMPEMYYFLASENGNVEEPTHWAYQPDEFYTLSGAQPAPSTEYVGWYCAHCERGVDASEVTYHEQHQVCGRIITDDKPPKPAPPKPQDQWGVK
jgi:hypothetical protein